jgi:hypothetical protein
MRVSKARVVRGLAVAAFVATCLASGVTSAFAWGGGARGGFGGFRGSFGCFNWLPGRLLWLRLRSRLGLGLGAWAGAGACHMPMPTLIPTPIRTATHTLAAMPPRRPRPTHHLRHRLTRRRGSPATPAPMFAPWSTPFPPAARATACPIITRVLQAEPVDFAYAWRAFRHTTTAFASTGITVDANK